MEQTKKLIMIGFRPGKKKRIKERTVILVDKNEYSKKDFAFVIKGRLSDNYVNQ